MLTSLLQPERDAARHHQVNILRYVALAEQHLPLADVAHPRRVGNLHQVLVVEVVKELNRAQRVDQTLPIHSCSVRRCPA